ncbi:MAG TPA: DUF5666 domain-containing protein [Pseudomonadales bacterium]
MKYRGLLLIMALALSACGGGGGGGSGGGPTTGGGGAGGGGTGGGGGGGTPPPTPNFQFDTGIGGSGGVIGDIDGFGSIIINGLELETDGDTDYFIEGEPDFSQDDLREGYYIVVAGDISNNDADEVFYRSNLKGPVSAAPVVIDALTGRYQLTVLGQTVITSASTRFSNVLAANIVQGNLLEVSGPIDSLGRVLATYVERKASLTEYKAIGSVSSLNTNDETFDLGGLAVTYTGAAFSDFDGASLANGQLVEVKMAASGFTAPASATVTEVELLPVPSIEEGAELEVEGYIDSYTSQTQFTVSGVPVTTNASTTYEDGAASGLAANVKVEVEGTANASGVIVAERIEFKSDDAIRVEGRVTSVDVTGGTVTALGITFEIRASTELEDARDNVSPFTINDLDLGDYIEARGFLDGSVIVTVELERDDSDPRARLRGPLTAISEPTSTLDIQGVTVTEALGTTSYDGDSSPAGRTNFYNQVEIGTSVEADWDAFVSLADPADELTIEND